MTDPAAPNLREIKKRRTRAAIVAAAMNLFDEHGYDAVTVAAVAEAAEVGQRTLYRHFADKEDFLFAPDDELHHAMTRAAAAAPDDGTGLAVFVHAVRAAAEILEPQREMLVRRARVIARTPALQAREGLKQAALQQLFTDELVRRGHPPERARLVAGIGMTCAGEALARWLEDPDHGSLDEIIAGVEADAGTLGTPIHK
ncbi:TetR family transcriptional regulator [Pseudonocardia nematodicida]|uniref:TetR family transcriptional regulator n=1 Tax=Pseudonocardia nematodicida TaxID=1206997 RepID=A0ABV1K7A9_9PSEU